MQATADDLQALVELQSVDLDIIELQKRLDALPQRDVIRNAREKRKVLEEKRSQIDALKKSAQKKLTSIEDEDASLSKKEAGVQTAIENAGNDFRNAESRSKELEGISRRRGTLADDREKIQAELDKIVALEEQVAKAMKDIDRAEFDATESFKLEGGELKQSIAASQARRAELLDEVDYEVAKLYDRTSKLFDTVFIGKLDGNRCSVCRTTIEAGRLIQMRSEAPLTSCPSCKRLLIVDA